MNNPNGNVNGIEVCLRWWPVIMVVSSLIAAGSVLGFRIGINDARDEKEHAAIGVDLKRHEVIIVEMGTDLKYMRMKLDELYSEVKKRQLK